MKENHYSFYFNKNILMKKINSFLMFVLVFSMVFFPSDSLNTKIISFMLLLILNVNLLVKQLFRKENGLLLFFGVVFPMLLVILSTLTNNFDFYAAISNAYIMLYILLVIIINYYDLKYESMLIFCLTCLSVIITISGLLDLFGIYNLSNNFLLEFFRVRNEARVGYWPATTFGYVLFFKASPLLIILVSYSYMKKKYLLLIISIIAMAFTGTRANLYASFLVIILYFLFYKSTTMIKVIISLLVTMGLFFVLTYIVEFIKNVSVQKITTDMIKYNHFISIISFLAENPFYIITGSGLGSYFFSTGVMEYTNLIELAYLDLFRQIGLIGFLPFMYFLIYPIKKLFKTSRYQWIGISYLGYLVIAFTNPLLFSSTPFILYVYVYIIVYKERVVANY